MMKYLLQTRFTRFVSICMAFSLGLAAFSMSAGADSDKKRIFFIGTGGTIAGIAQDPGSPNYDPAQVTIQAILDAVPDIKELADVAGEQLLDTVKMQQLIDSGMSAEEAKKKSYVNICSCEVSEPHWQLLAKRVEKALEADGNDAVIVTHGTDTIEETSFALQFLVHSDKPVILVGAARPSNDPHPDGPDNVRNAVRAAISGKAEGKGVMVIMGGRIYPAFDITEVRAMNPNQPLQHRFLAPNFGLLGEFSGNDIVWNNENKLLNSKILKLKFNTEVGTALPKVPILLQYAGNDTMDLIPMYEKAGLKAFVSAGFGIGSTPAPFRLLIKEKMESNADIVFVSASRTKESVSPLEKPNLKGYLFSSSLSPYHAKIFMQLVLDGLARQQPDLMELIKDLPPTATIRDKIKAIWAEYLYRALGFPET